MIELKPWERMMLLRVLPAVVLVAAVVVVALAVLVQRNDDNIERLAVATAHVQASTERVERFVDQLEEETPSEAERNAAITRAVQLVPEIKDILCGEFADAAACQPTQPGG